MHSLRWIKAKGVAAGAAVRSAAPIEFQKRRDPLGRIQVRWIYPPAASRDE